MFACLRGDERVHEVARRCAARRERIADDAVLFLCENRAQIEPLCSGLQLGTATTRFVAEVAGNAAVAPGEERHFLAPLSATLLPIAEVRKLRMLGLTTLGHVANLTEEELYAILGDDGFLAFELARGIDERPLIPAFDADPLEIEVDVDEGWEPALQRLFSQLQGQLCRELWCGVAVRFSAGTADWECAARHIRERHLFPMRFVITETIQGEERQLGLFHRRCRLSRQAQSCVSRVVWDDPASRLPERRAHLERLSDAQCRPLCAPRPVQVRCAGQRPASVGRRKVVRQSDRWKIDEDWWTDQPVRRTYYRLQLEGGAERRLFRDRHTGRWFAH